MVVWLPTAAGVGNRGSGEPLCQVVLEAFSTEGRGHCHSPPDSAPNLNLILTGSGSQLKAHSAFHPPEVCK